MDNQLLTQQTLGAIVSILQIAIPIGIAFLGLYKAKVVDYINIKIATIKDEKTRKLVQDCFDRVDDLLDTEISNAENTTKKEFLLNIANGTLNKDSLETIGLDVVASVTNQLNEKTTTILSQEVTDVQGYIASRLEKILGDLKVDDSSSVSKTILPEIPQTVVDNTELQNQLAQLQSDKDTLTQQIAQVTSDKSNIEQANAQLSSQVNDLNNQVSQLANDKQTVQAKLDSINATLNQGSQPVVDTTSTSI